jgi:hypothetical protein
MCGIKAKLQIKDFYGNHIVLNVGNVGENDGILEEKPKDNVLKLTC